MTSDVERQVLEERARQLAKPAAKLELPSVREHLLVFRRGQSRYGIDTRYVLEVVRLSGYAVLPEVPAYCLGIVAARGELLALFDLPVLLGEARSGEAPRSLLLCGESRPELALAVDEAASLSEARLLLSGEGAHNGIVLGLHPEGFAVIDGHELLTDPRLTLDPKAQEQVP